MSEVQQPDPTATKSVTTDQVADTTVPDATTAAPVADPTRVSEPAYIAESPDKGTNVTPFVKPDLQPCPNCPTGLLYVIGYDDKALHEVGQPIYFPVKLSGGSVSVHCFTCGHGETHPLNPQDAPVNPNSGA